MALTNRSVVRVCAFIEGRGVVVAYQSAMARKPEPQALPAWIIAIARWAWRAAEIETP